MCQNRTIMSANSGNCSLFFLINVAEEGAGRYVKVLQDEMLDDAIRTFARGDQGEIFDLTNRVAERFAGHV
jgi:hypothetical protein